MPKRDIQTIAHASATNHRIVASPDEPFPDVAFHQTTASLPDLIHIDPAPGQAGVPPPLLTQLAAYGELAQNKPEYTEAYLKVLRRLEQTEPNEPTVQAALGRRDLKRVTFRLRPRICGVHWKMTQPQRRPTRIWRMPWRTPGGHETGDSTSGEGHQSEPF